MRLKNLIRSNQIDYVIGRLWLYINGFIFIFLMGFCYVWFIDEVLIKKKLEIEIAGINQLHQQSQLVSKQYQLHNLTKNIISYNVKVAYIEWLQRFISQVVSDNEDSASYQISLLNVNHIEVQWQINMNQNPVDYLQHLDQHLFAKRKVVDLSQHDGLFKIILSGEKSLA